MKVKHRILVILIVLLTGGLMMADNPEIIESNDFMEEGYIKVEGGKVWYRILGKEQKAVPLLIVHGGPGASHTYLQPLEKLAQEMPVIFYDQLGCGKSEKPDDNSLWAVSRFVDELQDVRSALELDSLHILGQSWGSSLTVEYILTQKPTGVKSLILSAPLLSTSRWIKDQQKYIEQLSEESRKTIKECEQNSNYEVPEYLKAMMEFYQKHVCRLKEWPPYLNEAFSDINLAQYNYMWGPSEFTVTGTLINYERVDELKNIQIPVLFTCGEFDEAAPSTVSWYQNNLPGSKLHVFEDASHEHHIEKPEEYLKIIKRFIKDN
jgi:proline iminopeptidase